MSIIQHIKEMRLEDVEQILDLYEALGPLPGIGVTFIEAFLPFLPLLAIIVANVNAYGPFKGFLFSWTGVVLGAMSVFLISRWIGLRFRYFLETTFPKSKKLFDWIEKKGFTPIFLLSCFPFTPSALVNITAGMSRVPTMVFFLAILLGKAIMILIVTTIGYDLRELIYHPWKLVSGGIVLFILWIVGKQIDRRISS